MRTNETTAPITFPRRPPENALREMIRVFGLVEKVMQPYFARFGISGAQWGIMRNLHWAEQDGLPGLRSTDLSERLLIRPPSVTGVVDRLQRAGLVVRRGSTTDLRADGNGNGVIDSGDYVAWRIGLFFGSAWQPGPFGARTAQTCRTRESSR